MINAHYLYSVHIHHTHHFTTTTEITSTQASLIFMKQHQFIRFGMALVLKCGGLVASDRSSQSVVES